MIRAAAIAASLLLTAPALAAPSDKLATIKLGAYACELPGESTGPAGHPVPAEDFAILNGSSYRNALGRGTYLLIGNRLVMTSGPKRGEKFRRLSDNFLRKLQPDQSESALRCVRRTRNNS